MNPITGGKHEAPADRGSAGGPMLGLDRMGEPIIDPAPDRPPGWEDSPTGKAVFKGAKWGAVAGLAIGQFYISSNSIETPFGSIYTGNVTLVLIGCIGVCSALGAGIGWVTMQDIGGGDDDRPRPIE